MTYQVLARKYRPQTFKDLVGQEALVKTLTNAITNNKIHHAYLFTGIRGVGKTTTARIVAKSLNCEMGLTSQPCGVCSNCTSITAGNHPDVFEFDAASNRGIDDAKELLSGIVYEPITARKKIYIIDEVHMMTKEAFNSLLKTLEEPPANVVFIFATTEVNKVPATILSRCQKFVLRGLSADELSVHLRNICQKEGVAINDNALFLIGTKADGSVRDSLSILDQVIISADEFVVSGDSITADVVSRVINVVDSSDVVELLNFITSNKPAESIAKLNQMLASSFTEEDVVNGLMALLNDILKVKVKALPEELVKPEVVTIAKELSVPLLLRLWQVVVKSLAELYMPGSNKAKLEIAIIKMCYGATLPSPAEIVAKIKDSNISEVLSTFNAQIVD
jgi:DNA polymerase III subunit gamma/tau